MTIAENPRSATSSAKPSAPHAAAPILTSPAPRDSAARWDARISAALDTLERDGTLAKGTLSAKVRARIMARAANIITAEERSATRYGRLRPVRIASKVATLIAQQTATLTETMADAKVAARKADAAIVEAKALACPDLVPVAWTLVLKSGSSVHRLTAQGRTKAEAKADAVAREGAEWERAKVYRPENAPAK